MVTTTIENITPSTALKMLERNTKNRPVNENNLAALTREIANKNFAFTGESIKFAKDGTLLDGQHRLLAITKAGTAAKMIVIRGLDNDAFKYMDTGRTRQAADVLAIEGHKNAARMAAMSKFIIAFKKGVYNPNNTQKARGSNRITNVIISDFVNRHHKSLNDSYEFGYGKGKRLISGTLIASMHYILKQINEAEADDFINRLVEGTQLTKESPIHLLRERFIIDSRNKLKIKQTEKIALIVKAWNAYRKNKKVSVLRWDASRENFPIAE
jgi:hypothetical protein